MAAELTVIDKPEIAGEVVSLPERAKSLIISDQASYDLVAELGKTARTKETIIREFYKPRKAAADAVHQQWCDDEKMLLNPIVETKRICGEKISAWDREQERIRREAERKAREEAARIEEELRLQAAIAAENMGAVDEVVEEILERPIPIPAPVMATTYKKASGVSTGRTNYKAEVFDIKELCRAVASGQIASTYVEANMVALNKVASAEKEMMKIPGVRAINVPVTSFRGR